MDTEERERLHRIIRHLLGVARMHQPREGWRADEDLHAEIVELGVAMHAADGSCGCKENPTV